jgi:superfamily I DNA/RNA helicase
LKNLLASQFEEENAEIIRLTANQFKILEGFRRTPRIAIGGCAGSGKTLLALQKATQLAAEGFATLLLCYNRKLANHLESLVKGQPLLEVKTFHQFCVDAAKFSNQTLPAIAKLTQQQLEIEYALILCEAMSSRPEKRYDAIIVDEAQDFHKDWWDALETSLKSGSQSILYAFYDDNQKIYRRMGGLPSTMPSYDLYDNIRNSQPIFRCAETFYACDNDRRIEPRGPAVRPVEWLRYQNRSDLQQCLSNIIKRLTKDERVATTDIVILTPRSLDERSCLLQLKLAGDLKIVKHGAPVQGDEIAASTINSFKGLESNVVIVTELDEDFQNRPLNELTNLLYVATSRAKNLLVVLSHYKFNEEIYHAN